MSRHTAPGTTRPLDSSQPHMPSPKDGDPGLLAPMRKARSQKPVVSPRKLRLSSCLSLRATRLAAASRLRRSCHQHRGPVALPRSGRPAAPSIALGDGGFAAAVIPPHPAAFCGRALRLSPPVSPVERRAIFNNHQQIQLQTKTPTPNTPSTSCCPCFGLRIHSGPSRKACVSRTFVLNSPLWGLWSPQAIGDRPVGFAAARRRARGSACKTRRGKFPPSPLFARAKPAAATFRHKPHRECPTAVASASRISWRQASRSPPSAPRPPAARAAQVCSDAGVAQAPAAERRTGDPRIHASPASGLHNAPRDGRVCAHPWP